MAHTCPECGCRCHCGGDIDDLCFGVAEKYCCHCEEDETEEDGFFDDFDDNDHPLNPK